MAAARNHWNDGIQHAITDGLPAASQRPLIPDEMKSTQVYSPLLARNAAVFAINWGPGWHVLAVRRADGTMLWRIKLPAQPAFGGLSMTRGGDVLVLLADGRVCCLGAKE